MAADMTRAEHMDWCKRRAYVVANSGDGVGAIASFASDISKHPDTEGFKGMIGMLMLTVDTSSTESVKRFIEGFA